MSDLASGLIYYVVFLFSTTLHEAAHAWAAKLGGDLTAYRGGQVTLDPRPHIRREPFGMVVLPLISSLASGFPFGFASAPYDPAWALKHPRRAALMALAGPASNLLLVLIAVTAIRLGAAAGVFHAPESVSFGEVVNGTDGGSWQALAKLAGVFFSLNLLLAVFNLIPLPPLDGSAAIPLALRPDAAQRYQRFLFSNPGLGIVGILVAWQAIDKVFHPVFLLAVNTLFPGTTYR
ncbi:MAG TPA: site-2 protease family protein [Gemmatimonadales bacterium]|nr:site-2 protease family protein [Gemmatimonadales bacterium]